ncbi:hypothetical protein KFK09_019901 [Dendrobium nobile]|uniref:Uncharacterized protein n=1 Tax=Dendrobium nobile TaxID=94219 RepID=A0A8T3ASB8_DENNO|nr:hypothetical protein KFK09_019901 [Dendrobium nobile]
MASLASRSRSLDVLLFYEGPSIPPSQRELSFLPGAAGRRMLCEALPFVPSSSGGEGPSNHRFLEGSRRLLSCHEFCILGVFPFLATKEDKLER